MEHIPPTKDFVQIVGDLAQEFMEELLAKDPSWREESISEDETGDVLGELLTLFTKFLVAEEYK